MNRELKFRVWDKEKKLFIPTDVYGVITTDFNAFGVSQTISQYTGLKDKNGKDIYEGDVVEVETKGKLFRGQVKWNQQSASFIFINEKRYMEIISQAAYGDGEVLILDKVEIIGNLYDHPNLLTQ